MRINLFDTIRECLNRRALEVAQSRGFTQERIYQQIRDSLDVMLEEWKREDAPSIPYQDEVCQLAYVYSHVAMNAQLLYKALGYEFNFSNERVSLGSEFLRGLEGTNRLRICTFGSGPGTELLGISKFLGPKRLPCYPVELDVLHIDRVAEWRKCSEALEGSIASQFGHQRKLTFLTSFLPWDSSTDESAQLTTALERRQLFIFSYVVSELLERSERDAVADLLLRMARASSGAVFLFIDRCSDNRTKANISSLIASAGMHSIAEDTLSNGMDYEEDAGTSLKTYIKEIGRMPRGSRNGGKTEACFVIAKAG